MDRGEFYVVPESDGINKQTGAFLKGHVPFNKGKKWEEYLSKSARKRCAKGWKNVEIYRPTKRPDNAGRCAKKVIAVRNNGSWFCFASTVDAALWVNGDKANVRRCCRENREMRVNRKTGKINTNHQYKGVRFYYESAPQWMEKINKPII